MARKYQSELIGRESLISRRRSNMRKSPTLRASIRSGWPEAWGPRRVHAADAARGAYQQDPARDLDREYIFAHAGALAQHFGTLDELSNGRMIIGLAPAGRK